MEDEQKTSLKRSRRASKKPAIFTIEHASTKETSRPKYAKKTVGTKRRLPKSQQLFQVGDQYFRWRRLQSRLHCNANGTAEFLMRLYEHASSHPLFADDIKQLLDSSTKRDEPTEPPKLCRDDQVASSAEDGEETTTGTLDVESTSEEQATELGAHGRPRRKASMGMNKKLIPWWKEYASSNDGPHPTASADGQSVSEEDQTSVGVAGGNDSEQRDGVNQGRNDDAEEEGEDDDDDLWKYSSSSDEEEKRVRPTEDMDFDMKDSEDGSGSSSDDDSSDYDSEYDSFEDLNGSAEHFDDSTVESMLDDRKKMLKVLENGCLGCKKCPSQRFATNRDLLEHVIKHSKGKSRTASFMCNECDFQTTMKSMLENHVKARHRPLNFKCDQCEYAAYRKYILDKHYLRCHASESEKVFVCPQKDCSMRYALKQDFKCHLKHHQMENVLCYICGESVKKSYLSRHITRKHREVGASSQKRILCELCGKQYMDKVTYESHKRKHLNIKPFKCQFCGKGFTDARHVRNHQRIHTGEKPFKCKSCDLAFAKKAQLVSHERTHTGEKPYKCSKCKYQSCWNVQLRQHIKAHGAPTEVSCDICRISFISQKSLNIHDKKEHHVTK